MGGFAGAVEVAEGGEGQGEDGEVGEGEEEGEPVHGVGMGIAIRYVFWGRWQWECLFLSRSMKKYEDPSTRHDSAKTSVLSGRELVVE